MKIIHITDIHFGPYHWKGNDNALLERLNAFDADFILNTGDITTDALECEFQQARDFLNKIKCKNIVSIIGNHDKFGKRSHDFFRKYIYDGPFIEPKNVANIKKNAVYQNEKAMKLDSYLYDVNFVQSFDINNEKILIVGLDTAVMNMHEGEVEEEILHALSDEIKSTPHDRIIMLTHHSILTSDEHPLSNSQRVADFILKHDIEASFCGHTHELNMVEINDIIRNKTYRQFMSGTMSGRSIERDINMYCTYENFGTTDEKITIVRMTPDGDDIKFEETIVK